MTAKSQHSNTPSLFVSITKAAKIEKIVEYSFERNEKSNVLAIHPTRPLIAYLINIQRSPKISKGWSSGNDSLQSPPASSINGQTNQLDKNKTVSIRIIDYVTRQRCLAKGIYHARPAECVFTINSLQCSQEDIIKLAVVDRLANIYLYNISYFINDLTATRIAVIRGPAQEVSPYEYISLVWCPFVPCEDFNDGDGGLRLALSTNSKIEIFAIDRLPGKTGEFQRSDLKGAYKCITDAHKANIVTLSISPDCSTISAAASDNRVTFFSSDIDDSAQRCLHSWDANVADKSPISKLFFLDDYPKLLDDSTMEFWGAAFIGTRSGQMMLIDLRTWSIYQKMTLASDSALPKSFDYRIDLTSRNIVAMNGNQCYVVQIEHPSGKKHGSSSDAEVLPKIVRTINLCSPSRSGLHNSPIYSFVIKHKSDDELEMFTISACSLERYIINLNALKNESAPDVPMSSGDLKRFLEKFDGGMRISSSSSNAPYDTPNQSEAAISLLNASAKGDFTTATPAKHEVDLFNLMNVSLGFQSPSKPAKPDPAKPAPIQAPISVPLTLLGNNGNSNLLGNSLTQTPVKPMAPASADAAQVDRMVEILFNKLNSAFSQGLDEFLSDVKSEVNDLKLKLDGVTREVRRLQQTLDRQK